MTKTIKKNYIKIKKFKFFRPLRLLNVRINKFNYETSFKIREYIYYALILWIIALFVNIQKEVFVNIYNKRNEGGTLFTILKEIINKIDTTGILFTILIVMIIGMFYFMKTDYKRLKRVQKREKKVIKKTEELRALKEKIEQESIHKNEIFEFQKEMIERLANAIESKDGSTGNHVRRVADYSYALGELYGLDEKSLNQLKLISPLHDIGKIAIPDNILKKPAKLDDSEIKEMNKHSEEGKKILQNSKILLIQKAELIAYQHHEKWDGSGYPNGLKGDDISIEGRITAIADVFDALSNERVYKKAWSRKDIEKHFQDDLENYKRKCERCEEKCGKCEKCKKCKVDFDPELNKLFLSNLDKFYSIKKKYPNDGK